MSWSVEQTFFFFKSGSTYFFILSVIKFYSKWVNMCSHFTYLFSRQDYTFYPPKSSNYGGHLNWINNFNIILLYECKLAKNSARGLSKCRLSELYVMFFHVNYWQVITWFPLQFGVLSTCKFFQDYKLHLPLRCNYFSYQQMY